MLSKESGATNFDLPEEVLEVLPSDPFEQLDVARKITSIALSTRVSALESESSTLRHHLSDKDSIIADLQAQIDSLDSSLSDIVDKLFRANQEKENLLRENASLSDTVRKLNRDVSKLESFRKTCDHFKKRKKILQVPLRLLQCVRRAIQAYLLSHFLEKMRIHCHLQVLPQ